MAKPKPSKRVVLYNCAETGCSNVAHREEAMMAKNVWQQYYDHLRRCVKKSTVPTKEFNDCLVIAIRKIDSKGALVIQGKKVCQDCSDKAKGGKGLDALPQKDWRSRGQLFTEFNNKGTGKTYSCARCGKPVRSWVIVRNGLTFGYRCARKIAIDLRDGVQEEEIFTDIMEAQELRSKLRGSGKTPSPKVMRKEVLTEMGHGDLITNEEQETPNPEEMSDEVKIIMELFKSGLEPEEVLNQLEDGGYTTFESDQIYEMYQKFHSTSA